MSRRLAYPAAIVLVAALYFGAAKLGLLAAVAQKVVSSAWPPTGFALAVLLLFGRRLWPGIALGAFLLNATSGVPVIGAAGMSVGNTLEAVVGAALLERWGFRLRLERLRDVLALVTLAALASTMLSATIGVASLWLTGTVPAARYGSLWFVWWSGDAMGDLLVAPLLLTWAGAMRAEPRWSWPRVAEGALLLLALVLLTDLVFRSPRTYVYAVFPVVAWAALRFGSRGSATTAVVVAVLTVWYTLRGLGPFAEAAPTEDLARLQIFLALLSVSGLVLAAVSAERTAALRASRESERRYQELLENAPEAILVHQDGRWTFVNRAAAELLGAASPEGLLGRPVLDLVHPGSHAFVRERIARQVGDTVELLEEKFVALDGRVLDVEVVGMQITLDGKQARQIIVREVGERQRAAAALRASETRLRAVLNAALDAHIMIDAANLITAWNPQAEAMFGWPASDAIGRNLVVTVIPPRYRETFQRAIARFLSTGEGPVLRGRMELTALHRDGHEFPAEVAVTPVHQDGAWFFTAFVRDITDRKRAEAALRSSEQRFRDILEAAPDAMVVADPDGRIVLVNRQMENVFGYSQRELIGRPVESLMPDRFRESHRGHRAGYLRQPVSRPMGRGLELFAVRKDGSEFPVDISLSPLETDEGTLVMAGIRDVTERKRAEDALGASRQRLAALSRKLLEAQEFERMRIARDLHDQVGQALTAVKLNIEALHRAALEPGHPAPFTETIQAVEHAIEDVRALSLELRPALLDDLGLAAAVTAYAKRQATRAGLELGLAVSPIGQWVPKDVEIACFRVLQEMVTNVVRHSGAHRLDIQLRADDGSLRLEVSDDGRGFDTRAVSTSGDAQERLGLLGMQERAELVGGEVAVDSRPGAGTVVRARFPLAVPRRSSR